MNTSSQKLTKDLRETIQKAVLTHRFSAKCAELGARVALLADQYRQDVCFGSAAFMKKADSLPSHWLIHRSHTWIATGHRSIYLHHSGTLREHFGELPTAVFRAFPISTAKRLTDPENEDLAKALDTLAEDIYEYEREVITTSNTVGAVLKKHTTTTKLIAAWPEVEPFIPKVFKPAALPTITNDKLNAMLELPVE